MSVVNDTGPTASPIESVQVSEFSTGERIEARYDGKRSYYPGVVFKINRDGSCVVHYDDGDKEYRVSPMLIRRPLSQRNLRSNKSSSTTSSSLKDKVIVEDDSNENLAEVSVSIPKCSICGLGHKAHEILMCGE
jgi:hypothetical protein